MRKKLTKSVDNANLMQYNISCRNGEVPEWLKGADCKSAAFRFVGSNPTLTTTDYRGVEQLVARRAHNPKVVGSSPAPATNLI